MERARVIKSTGSWYTVRLEDGALAEARAKGKLRIQGIRSTNPLAVGDWVKVSKSENGDLMVTEVEDRKNYLVRKATNLSHQTHIVAANIDLAIILITLNQPRLKIGFLDRFLVTAEAYNIPAAIVANKLDIYSPEELEYLQILIRAYEDIGYAVLPVSVSTGEGMENVQQLLAGKTTLVAGHSGVGKSSMLNHLKPGLGVKISTVSDFNEKGRHTTTFAEMHETAPETYVIDSPGLKNFSLVDMGPEELKDYFPEMVRKSSECKFYNCLHLKEPQCAVREAYEKGELPYSRYENYQILYNELLDEKQ